MFKCEYTCFELNVLNLNVLNLLEGPSEIIYTSEYNKINNT